jgi:hypothetical protein
MNTIAFGSAAWNLAHKLPRTYPSEILSDEDGKNAIRFVIFLSYILPCGYCRDSATVFVRELDILNRLTVTLPNGKRAVTRAKFSECMYILQNRVNFKLNKPCWGTGWMDAALLPRPGWKSSAWTFLFAVCWNYPESETKDSDIFSRYLIFFRDILPGMLKYTDLGRKVIRAYGKYPVTDEVLSGRRKLTRWIYDVRACCADGDEQVWTFEETDVLVEAFRARASACSSKAAVTAPQPSDAEIKATLDVAKGCM